MRLLTTLVLAAALPSVAFAETDDPDVRPLTPTIGVGAGMTVPAGALTLNTGSVRIKLNDAITIEPALGYATTKGVAKTEVDDTDSESETASSAAKLEANIRYNLAASGSADFAIIGGFGYTSGTSETDPDGKDNNSTTKTSSLDLNVGLGIEAFAGEHWSVSMDALTTMLSQSGSESEEEASEATTTVQSSGFSVPLDPSVRVMAHLYF